MAKLSLWLITLAKGQPFSFLDHALRCGDSLLGISDIGQLTHWSLRHDDGVEARQTTLITRQVEEALAVALRERQKIAGLRVREARDADLKAGWLATADAAMALVKLGADLLVAAALHPDPKMRQRKLKEWLPRYSLLLTTAEDTRAGKLTIGGQAPGRAEYVALRREANNLLDGRRPFHWPLEFPESFRRETAGEETAEFEKIRTKFGMWDGESLRSGFAAFVGNPPFLGGTRISTTQGNSYLQYLQLAYPSFYSRADLCGCSICEVSNC
jgi:hypothetical protein